MPDSDQEPHMSPETYRLVMGYELYSEPERPDFCWLLGHRKMPDFSRLSFKNGIECVHPQSDPYNPPERIPLAGIAYTIDGKHCEDPGPAPSLPVRLERWQTRSSKRAWAIKVRRMKKRERISVFKATHPNPPHACRMCKDLNDSKKGCKLPEQGMLSLCSRYMANRKLLVLPENKRASMNSPFMARLRKHEQRNRPAKIWRMSTLPTLNRNDGKFLRYDIDENGQPIRVYSYVPPRLVPEVAYSHDRTEDDSGYDECAFPDEWKMELAELNIASNDDYVYLDTPESDIKKQCFEMPKPEWISVIRRYTDNRKRIVVRTESHHVDDVRTEWVKVWHRNDRSHPELLWYVWAPEEPAFTFTLEERKVRAPLRRDEVILRTEEYPTLINVRTEEMFAREMKAEAKASGVPEQELRAGNTILVQSETVITKKERKFFDANRIAERRKRKLTGFLIAQDASQGKAIPRKGGASPISVRARR